MSNFTKNKYCIYSNVRGSGSILGKKCWGNGPHLAHSMAYGSDDIHLSLHTLFSNAFNDNHENQSTILTINTIRKIKCVRFQKHHA
jgi:hypothetical protein